MTLRRLARSAGRRARLVLRRAGMWPRAVSVQVPAGRPAADAAGPDVVFFHADYGEPVSVHGTDGAVSYAEMMALMIASIRLVVPGARIVMLTNRRTPVPAGVDVVMRSEVHPALLMADRLFLQREYVRRHAGRRAVLCDTDVLFQRDVAAVFEEHGPFDVALTWRGGYPKMPLNGGVIFAECNERTEAFFSALLERMNAMTVSARQWYGDQMALADLVGRDRVRQAVESGESRIALELSRDGRALALALLLLPCRSHNHSPDAEPEAIVDGCYVLHFKGKRKRWMPAYLARLAHASGHG